MCNISMMYLYQNSDTFASFLSETNTGISLLSFFRHKCPNQKERKYIGITPVGISKKGFVSSDFGMFLLLDYCIENERGSVGLGWYHFFLRWPFYGVC